MAYNSTPLYLSSFLLEKNRWNGKGPSMLVSEWIEPMVEAGFKGLEIWAPHLLLASRSEWEAIREKASDTDIPVVFLYALLPTDNSDKSNRFRDTMLEAMNYFDCQGLKFTFTENAASIGDKFSFAGEWARDLPRNAQLLPVFEKSRINAEEIAAYRKVFGSRFRCSALPFSANPKELEKIFSACGDSLVNLGLRPLSEAGYGALRDFEEECDRLVSAAHKHGFKGSWSLETTAGTGAPGEDAEMLFYEAEDDLNFFVSTLRKH
ncbi:MAG TPA: hypothetical protein DCQ83_05440 [Fibrobacteres bacterium]|jgi:hypothetical protein|nr:hypothetical protein [Fibrobacterota bacterium]